MTAASDPQALVQGRAGEYEAPELQLEEADSQDSRLWPELVQRYHYLGHRVTVGAQLRYVVRSAQCGDGVLACLQWSSAAWKMAVRDRWIGWSAEQRARNLPYLSNKQPAPDSALGAGAGAGQQDPGPVRAPVARRLGAALRLPAAAAGDGGRYPALLKNLLSPGQLD